MKKTKRKKRIKNKKATSRNYAKSYDTAAALYQNGRMEDAMALLEDISLNSKVYRNGEVAHLKGAILLKCKNFSGAIKATQQAVRLAPQNTEFINTLALALDEAGRPIDALQYLSKASSIKQGQLKTFKNMAFVLRKMDRHEQSLICFKKALALAPNDLHLLKTIGYNYYLLGDLEQAAECYEKALEQEGDHSEVWSAVGGLFQSKGDAEGARICYQKSLEANPNYYNGYELYAHSGEIPDEERRQMIARLEQSLLTRECSDSDLRHIHFALGRFYHDLKDYDNAFNNYVLGNEFRGKVLGKIFLIKNYEKEIDVLKSIFTKPVLQRRYEGSSSSRQPVFVVGMPRSGTTLLEQIIASHSKGFGAGELPAIKKIATTELVGLTQPEISTNLLQELSADQIQAQVEYYLSQLHRHAGSAERIVDKLPHNLQFLWCISILFPNAPVIYCRRDSRDTCLSCFVTNFNSGHGYKHDLFTLGRYYRIYEGLMEHWKQVVPNPVLTVQYEDLIEDAEKMSRQVIEHIGLEWEAGCLKLRSKRHFSQTASNVQIRKGIYRSALQRWKKYEKHLTPLLEGLGELPG